MRLAIFGGAGFLGRHLTLKHLEHGDEVTVVDNLFTGRRSNLEGGFQPGVRSTFADRFGGNFEFIRHDVCDPIHLEVDAIYNLACPAAPLHYVKNPVRTIETSVLGMLNSLRLARETGARVVFTSTSEVLGNPTVHPQTEKYWGNVDPIALRSVYDEGKRCGETLCSAYFTQFKVDVRIVRLFNVYGPFMARRDGRVVPSFIEAICEGRPLTLHGTGSQTRSFCYVDDAIEGIFRAMTTEIDPLLFSRVPLVHLGNPGEVSMIDLAKMICEIAGKADHPIRLADHPIGNDPERRCPDITLAKKWLGWAPEIALRPGLAKTIAWYREEGAL